MADVCIAVCAPAEHNIKICKWRVREGCLVSNSQVLLLYEICDTNDNEVKRLKSNRGGVVKKRIYKEGTVVQRGEPLLEICECIHTTVIKDMCADCGADLRQNENGPISEASVPMVHCIPELKVSQKIAQKLGRADTKRLLHDRKLVLLVDLDQTLIHTTNDNVPNNINGIYHFQLYGPSSPWYHTKLRPGTFEFLTKISTLYELHICTFGARNYAHMIAQFLDSDGQFFSYRILSRDECFNVTSKTDNLKALFPCGDSMVCIIDDREDVWNMAPNLIQVKPYHFFQHTGDINAPPGLSKHDLDGKGVLFKDIRSAVPGKIRIQKDETSSVMEDNCSLRKKNEVGIIYNNIQPGELTIHTEQLKIIPSTTSVKKVGNIDTNSIEEQKTNLQNETMIDINDPDDYLHHLETILKNIHEAFYKVYDDSNDMPDLKILVPKLRADVLSGKTLVFSGLVPNNMKLDQSRAYMIARSLGANVNQHLTDETTHLVAATAGTFKVNAARKHRHLYIVTPDWLWCCAERWEHVHEQLFPLDPHKPSKMRQPPPHCHSPEHVVNYSNNMGINLEQQDELKFIDTINPLLSFSNADLADMNQEFHQFFESDSSSDDEPVNIENPPLNKHLLKRKREEEKEERQRQFFSRSESNIFVVGEKNPEAIESNSSEEDEPPSAKFRRDLVVLGGEGKLYLFSELTEEGRRNLTIREKRNLPTVMFWTI